MQGLVASSGTVDAAYDYDGFGRTLRESGTEAEANPFRFASQYTDVETGLIYYGNRFYSPAMGRFINRDPIEEAGGTNLYGFCGNDGVNGFDLLGMDAQGDLVQYQAHAGSMTDAQRAAATKNINREFNNAYGNAHDLGSFAFNVFDSNPWVTLFNAKGWDDLTPIEQNVQVAQGYQRPPKLSSDPSGGGKPFAGTPGRNGEPDPDAFWLSPVQAEQYTTPEEIARTRREAIVTALGGRNAPNSGLGAAESLSDSVDRELKSTLDGKRANGIIHNPTASQARKINAVIAGLATFDDPVLQSISRMLARRTILVDDSLSSSSDTFIMGKTWPTISGYENVILLNPERIRDYNFYYKDGNGNETIPYSLLETLPHENLHLVLAEMGFADPGGKWLHDNVIPTYTPDILQRVLDGKPRK